jgi:hypothetical protein
VNHDLACLAVDGRNQPPGADAIRQRPGKLDVGLTVAK